MAWLTDKPETTTTENTESKWLKFEPLENIDDTTEVTVRILDEEPAGVWVHWLGDKPYNCDGISTCPVCAVRMKAKKERPDSYDKEYPMAYKYFFNVLVKEDGEYKTKIYSFGNGVGKKLKGIAARKGDLRDYDVTILKRKIGKLAKNVEYEIFYGEPKGLADEAQAVSENKYDLSEFVKPATLDVLESVARGETPKFESPSSNSEATSAPVNNGKATKADIMLFKALCESKGFELAHFGIDPSNPPAKAVMDALINDLKSED